MLKCIDNQKHETILLIHGFPEDASIWDNYISPLSKKYNLLILNSKNPPEAESLTLELLKNLRSLKSSALHIACHDIGGYLAVATYPYLQTEVKSLIFISASFPQLLIRRCASPKQLLKSWYSVFFQIPILSDTIWKKYASNIVKRLYPNDKDHLQNLERHTAWIALYRQAFVDIFKKKQAPITVPTLFIEATDDSFLEIHSKNDLAHFFTDIEQRVLQGGHWLVVEESEKVIHFMELFLEKMNGKRKTFESAKPIL
ncbi:MAG: alpha/beta fold hydrolase [Bdellovibrionales bacterium]|nr:alpha/beta fold hydrolase [Bdellovibrionales bacterium]